jgi:L-cysteine:1D-myo-inositol 2-amino-2-deoxy-alpha-D-glucopyranoside ligase
MQSWPAPPCPRLPGNGHTLRIFDAARSSVRPVRPAGVGEPVRMYVCGITPYDATHLGHAFTYLAYDTALRTLLDAGHQVRYVQNVTDIDDPLLERATRDGVDWQELARTEIELFRGDMAALRILPPTYYVGAVEAIPTIIELLALLVDRGAAYHIDTDLYFSVAACPAFGSVAHLSHEAMVALSADNGGDPQRAGKKDPVDPLLWRAHRPGEPSWPSPFGPGRPGWQIECAAIARRHLGETIDIQGGGSDLAFPHHECTAAVSEAASGVVPFARAFVHTGMVSLGGHKMSKSRGNLELVSRLRARGADPMALRLALLAQHYRRDWEWKPAALDAATRRLEVWRAAASGPAGPDARGLVDEVRRHLADDLDTPAALAAMDRWALAAVGTGTGSGPTGTTGTATAAGVGTATASSTTTASGAAAGPGTGTVSGADPGAPAVFRLVADALLGIDLEHAQAGGK